MYVEVSRKLVTLLWCLSEKQLCWLQTLCGVEWLKVIREGIRTETFFYLILRLFPSVVGWSRLLNFLVNKQCHVYNNNKSINCKFQIKFSESWMLEPLCSRSLWHCGTWAHPLLILLPPLSLLLLLQPHHFHQSCVNLLSDLPCDLEMFGAHIALTAVDTVAIELSSQSSLVFFSTGLS